MENSTKALIIAAAVLIAIVIIALGVKILGTSDGATTQANTVQKDLNNARNDAITSMSKALQDI